MQPFHAFKPDGVILFSDILTPLPGMGIDFDIVESKGPLIQDPIRTMAQVEALRPLQPADSMPFVGEVLGRLREGLQDVPMTRTNFSWGIPMPGDPGHVIYVWIDALFNYITALGLGDGSVKERAKYWPADYHVIGKEILWFHAVIWPAMLMALDLPLPKCVYAHSFWIRNGQKMSKSLGNFTLAADVLAEHDPLVVRYALAAAHYRSTLDLSAASYAEAEAALGRIETFRQRVLPLPRPYHRWGPRDTVLLG